MLSLCVHSNESTRAVHQEGTPAGHQIPRWSLSDLFLLLMGIKALSFVPSSPTAVPTTSSSSMSHVVITGAKGGLQQGAAAPNRMEINDFVKETQPFSLYIQALSEPHFMLLTSPDKINLFENSCHVPGPTGQSTLSLFYRGYPWPSLCSVGRGWWHTPSKRISVGWVLHSRLCSLPNLAQALCGSL